MPIKIVKTSITRFQLRQIAKERFGDLVKAAVDTEQEILAVGGELHIDEEVVLIEQEKSQPKNIWGINLYPDKEGECFIEYDSMINIKPNFGNKNRGVDDVQTRAKIENIVNKLIK
ncbi:MAG: DUF5674 family protein [Patescibacteria group bacterium]|nr:DUF5674 family protein [Patescibacteria group bacterium]